MKIKQGFVLRKVMDNFVVVAVGDASKSFRGMIKLNATAADVWQLLENGCSEEQICDTMLEKYDVERERLAFDVKAILSQFDKHGFLEAE